MAAPVQSCPAASRAGFVSARSLAGARKAPLAADAPDAYAAQMSHTKPPMPGQLLSALPAGFTQTLFSHAAPKKLAADQTLFVAGDEADGCYRVEKGFLKVTMVSAGGSERILAVMSAGMMLGELSMIDGEPRSASVVAIGDSELAFVSRADFLALAAEHPEVMQQIAMLLARRLRDTNRHVAAASFLSLKGRTARVLLTLADAFGQPVAPGRTLIRQKITQSDLAAMAGIARENVSRILNEWTRAKSISRISGYYCIEQRNAIEREAAL
jgi:CRP/FNR family cyclic AMP-dependent transcriptional regulator